MEAKRTLPRNLEWLLLGFFLLCCSVRIPFWFSVRLEWLQDLGFSPVQFRRRCCSRWLLLGSRSFSSSPAPLIASDAREGPTTSKTVPALFTTSHEVLQKRNRQNYKTNQVACPSDETHIPTNSRHPDFVKASQKTCTCTCTPKGTLVPKLSIPFPPAAIENSHRQRCSRQAADSTAQNELPISLGTESESKL